MKKIVLTGGPQGGKTEVVEAIKETFGEKVVLVPEMATLLRGGGFPISQDPKIVRWFQSTIYYDQLQFEKALQYQSPGAEIMVLDRATLDGACYWPEGREAFLEKMGTSLEKEYQRYTKVFHLETSAKTGDYEPTEISPESPQQAIELDKKIKEIWQDHPGYRFIPCSEKIGGKIKTVLVEIDLLLTHKVAHQGGSNVKNS